MESDELKKLKFTNLKWREKIQYIYENVTVEPIIFCCILPAFISSIATQNLNLNKACRVNLKYDDYICDRLAAQVDKEGLEEIEKEVQGLVAGMYAWTPFIRNSVPAVLILFMGSLSDILGVRKPFILLPIFGELCSNLGLIACTFFFYSWPMEVSGIIDGLFPALTGGSITATMAIFSYIGDLTTEKNRTFRIGILSIVTSLGLPLGGVSSGFLFRLLGYYGVYLTVSTFYIIGIIYGVFFLKESKPNKTLDENWKKSIFSPKIITNTLNVICRKRQGNLRVRIILMIFLYIFLIGPGIGEGELWYLYTRLKLNWDEIMYSLFSSYYIFLTSIGNCVSVWLLVKKLKLDDCFLGLIGCSCRIIPYCIYSLVVSTSAFYAIAILEVAVGCLQISIRAISSKLVPSEELGTINSVLGLCEAISPMLFKPLYSLVYKKSIHSFSGAFCVLTVIFTVPSIILFLTEYYLKNRDSKTITDVTIETENLENLSKPHLYKDYVTDAPLMEPIKNIEQIIIKET